MSKRRRWDGTPAAGPVTVTKADGSKELVEPQTRNVAGPGDNRKARQRKGGADPE